MVADGCELSEEVGVPEGSEEKAGKAEVRHGDGEDPADGTKTGVSLRIVTAVPFFRGVSEDTSRIGCEAGEARHPIPVTVETATAMERAAVGRHRAALQWLS